MRPPVWIAGLSLIPFFIGMSTLGHAATTNSAQAKACRTQAIRQHLTGERRATFERTCEKGSLATHRAVGDEARSDAAKAVVAPSGASVAARSDQCNVEAGRRKLAGAAFQSFRKGCLASVAPVGSIESGLRPTRPTTAKPKIEDLTNKPHP